MLFECQTSLFCPFSSLPSCRAGRTLRSSLCGLSVLTGVSGIEEKLLLAQSVIPFPNCNIK